MKKWNIASILIGVVCLVSCKRSNPLVYESMDEIIEVSNSAQNQLTWQQDKLHAQIDSMFRVDYRRGIEWLDSVIRSTISIHKTQKNQLLLHSSNILYSQAHYEEALTQCIKGDSLLRYDKPKNLIFEARCYIALEFFQYAQIALIKASDINQSYLWLLGNYYEIVDSIDMAKSTYILLYTKDTHFYKYCLDRIDSINEGVELLDSLDFSHLDL